MKRRTVLVACILWSLPGTLVAQAQAAKEPAPPPAGAPPSSAAAPPPPGTPQTAVAARPAEVDLSFQGAEIDVVVKWLAEVTGKSIVKHKGVQVKLNVLSSKKLPVKEAIGLVYRALALEGFSAVETPNVIVIVPEALESKVGTELIDESESPREGKQILVKVNFFSVIM